MDRSIFRAYGFGLLACMVWGGNFVVARAVHMDIPPLTLAFWRWVVALVAITLISLPHIKKDWVCIRQNLPLLTLIGVLSVGGFNTLIYYAAHTTSAHNIAIIASTSPVWILIMASLFKQEDLSRYQVMGMAVAMVGALLVIVRGDLAVLKNLSFTEGDLYVLAAAFIWAAYCILLRYKPKALHPSTFLLAVITIGVLALLPFYLYEFAHKGGITLNVNVLGVFAYLGVGASVIAWYAWNQATYNLGAMRTGVIYYTVPVFSGMAAIIWLGEAVYWYHYLAFILVVGGIQISRLERT